MRSFPRSRKAAGPRSRSWSATSGIGPWFGAETMTIADIALYAYTHVAGEGGFDLSDYPNVTAWLARVAAQPGHVPMHPAPEGVVSPSV